MKAWRALALTVAATVFEHFLCLGLNHNDHSDISYLVSLRETSLEFTIAARTKNTLLHRVYIADNFLYALFFTVYCTRKFLKLLLLLLLKFIR